MRESVGRLDRWVLVVIVGLLALIAAVVWRGDQLGLTVVEIQPPNDSGNISSMASIRVRFDQPLLTVPTTAQLTIKPAIEGALRSTIDGFLFAPNGGLQANTAYTVKVAQGLQGENGRRLLEPLTWQFRTGQSKILFSSVDDAGKEQLQLAANYAGELPEISTLSNERFGVWDFAVDTRSRQVLYSVLEEDGTSNLWLGDPLDWQPTQFLDCPQAACNDVAWSPDGQSVIYARRSASNAASPVVSPPRLWLMELASRETFQLFADNQQLGFAPQWSPDGQWISYVSPEPNGLGVINLADGEERFYATTSGEAGVWHPQRTELLFSRLLQNDSQYEVHLVRIDPLSDNETVLSQWDLPVEDNAPAWSPDGEEIAFRRKELDGPGFTPGKQLWRMREDGTGAEALTMAPEFDHGPPAWSPDGRYLLFHKFPLKGPNIVISIWLLDLENGQQREIASPGQRPVWIP